MEKSEKKLDLTDQICIDILKGKVRKLTPEQKRILQNKAFQFNYTKDLDTYANQRNFCESYIRQQLDSMSDVQPVSSNINVMILANIYENAKLKQEEEEIQRTKIKEENQRLQLRFQEEENIKNLIVNSKNNLRLSELDELYNNKDLNACQENFNTNVLTPTQVIPIIDDSLIGKNVLVDKTIWEYLFSQTKPKKLLSFNPLIQDVLINSYNYDNSYELTNEQVINLLGEDYIIDLIGEDELTEYVLGKSRGKVQIHLKISSLTDDIYPVYVSINGYHEDGKDILYVSPSVKDSLSLSGNNSNLIIQSCILSTVKTIYLLYLHETNNINISDEIIRNTLINKLSDYGVLQLGDILPIRFENTILYYRIERLISSNNDDIIAVKIPQIGQNVNVEISEETLDELVQKYMDYLGDKITNLDLFIW